MKKSKLENEIPNIIGFRTTMDDIREKKLNNRNSYHPKRIEIQNFKDYST